MPYCPWLAASDGAMFDAARRYRHDANLIRTIIYSSNDDEMRLPQRSTRIRGQYENWTRELNTNFVDVLLIVVRDGSSILRWLQLELHNKV